MGGIDLALLDNIISQQIDLLRLDAATRQQVLEILDKMQQELVAKLASEDLTDFGKQRTQALLKESSAVIDAYYARAQGELALTTEGLAHVVAVHTAEALTLAVTLDAVLPPQAFLQTLASNVLIQGAPSAEWWSRQSLDTSFKFANAVRQGIAQSETGQQIVARIIGKAGQPGIMDITKSNAAALVRSSVHTVANSARLETFRRNPDLINGVRQVSTLDGRTSDICLAYSGGEWDLDGKPINGTKLAFNGGPPRHWSCRSSLVAITKTFKELGIDLPEPPRTTRAAEGGPVAMDTSFDAWLNKRTTQQQDAQLGRGRAQLWRDGKITLAQLLDLKGNPLTLSQLQAKYL